MNMATARRFKRLAGAVMSALVVVVVVLVGMAFGETPTVTTFTDKRDGKTYKKVTIGKQVWMAENLNYDVPNNKTDVCYENKADNCAQYGRLYYWETALKACPSGWHLPTDKEWTTLENTDGNSKTAGTILKSASGWKDYKGKSGNGTDNYGFSALPGGNDYEGGDFCLAGYSGFWWSATEYTEYDVSYAWGRSMFRSSEDVDRVNYFKTYLFSVRCVQD